MVEKERQARETGGSRCTEKNLQDTDRATAELSGPRDWGLVTGLGELGCGGGEEGGAAEVEKGCTVGGVRVGEGHLTSCPNKADPCPPPRPPAHPTCLWGAMASFPR